MMRRRVAAMAAARLVAMAALLAGAPVALAHEIGTTQATATFAADGTYHVSVVVDPDALLMRLRLLEGEVGAAPAGRAERDRQLAALGQRFLSAVHVRFDGVADAPSYRYHPASALGDIAQAPSSVELSGRVPAGSRAFTFNDALTTATYAVVVHVGDGAAQTVWVDGSAESAAVSLTAPPPPPTVARTALKYAVLGFTHIVPKGLDHILFVIGLFLLGHRWRPVLLQVSSFTLAHSITLALTIYGVVSLPARVVEPLIALSIAYVAIENILTTELKTWRVALVFSFGLLHGMGFAGVLREVGLPRRDFLAALLTFNLGVEGGQLAVVALAFVLVAAWRRNAITYRRWIVQPASVVIALTGVYWTVQRLL